MVEAGARRKRPDGLHDRTGDGGGSSDYMRWRCNRNPGNTVHSDYGIRLIEAPPMDWFNGMRRTVPGPMWGGITRRTVTDIRSPAARKPPRISVAGGPAPSEAVVVVPIARCIRHVAPGLAGNPDIPELRRIDPVAAAVGIPTGVCGLIRRPDVALAGNVVPIPICIEIAPCRVVACGLAAGCGCLGSFLRRQILVAVCIPSVPRVRLNRFRKIVLVGIAAA